MERSVKHSIIAASVLHCGAMRTLLNDFEKGNLSKDAIESTLIAYNIFDWILHVIIRKNYSNGYEFLSQQCVVKAP